MKYPFPRRAGALILALALALSLAPAALAVDTCSIDPAALTLEVGKTETLTAKLNGLDVTEDVAVEWSCEGPISIQRDMGSFITIRADGATEAGNLAKVTAVFTREGEELGTAECPVAVNPAPVTGVTLNKDKLTLLVDESQQLVADVVPAVAADKSVIWSSDNVAVARVSSNGTVLGMSVGTAKITVTTTNGNHTASCEVTVKEAVGVNSVQIERSSLMEQTSQGLMLNLEREGQKETIAVTVMPTDATDKSLKWTSSDETIATVNPDGQITAVSPGIADITVASQSNPNAVDKCQVSVSGITLSETAITIKVGQSKSVVAAGYGRASGRLAWSSDDLTVASGSNNQIVGLAVGKTIVRVTAPGTNYEKQVEVTVEENTVSFDSNVNAGEVLYFSTLLTQLNKASQDGTTGKAGLKSITNVTVATKEGIIHYGYLSPDVPNHGVGGSEVYYVSPNAGRGEQAISDLKYVPAGGFSGTAVISYVGRSTRDETFNGTIRVTVKDSGDVMFSTAAGRPMELTAKAFKDICQVKTGRSASYVTFTQPSGNKGTLYYNYSPGQWSQKVDGTTKYYLSSTPLLEKVTFVPAEGFTGAVTVPYRCTDTTGGSYSGTMTINVYASSGSAAGGVEYTTGINQRVTLDPADFNEVCQDQNERTLRYICFDSLPAASEGTLYYNYTSASSTRVDTATGYNRANTAPRISSVTFVPATNFSGTVTIPYTGYDTAGETFKDNLVIHVSDAAGTVYYTTPIDTPVTFQAEDFNSACQRANGVALNYVTFTLPSTSVGALYRSYRNSTNTGTRISSGLRCYRGGTPSVSDITFVPRDRYEGTVSIPFSGRDINGDLIEGSVSISVGAGTGRVVSYSVATGGTVAFSAADFNAVSRAATGEDLNYLSFELPASRYGTLYYRYNTAQGSGTVVSASSSFYRTGGGSTRALDDVTFVAANINGTASFQFTGRSSGGKQLTGTVEIAIGTGGDTGYSSGTRYVGSSTPIALRTADFQAACQSAIGGNLAYIQFKSLPSESTGRLYLNYESASRPGGAATTTSNYTVSSGLSIGQLSFVPKAGYQGQVNIPYTGFTAQGDSFSGNVVIDLSTSYCATPFYDVDSGWDWAKPSVEFLRNEGVTTGYSNGSFRPSRSISRGEFTLMVCRAFGFDTTTVTSNFPDVPASSPYAGAVATARSMGIVEGSGGRFRPDSPITRQSAMAITCRAMKAAGRDLPTTGSSALSGYRDRDQIASHARDSVAALVALGVVQGNSSMQINPTRSISRAEMAVILHRVLTL